jgi:spore maturation protein CgeB
VLVSDLPDWNEMFVKAGYGRSCNPTDSKSIAEALRFFFDHQSETRLTGERGRRQVLEEWNYELQFEPVRNVLETR